MEGVGLHSFALQPCYMGWKPRKNCPVRALGDRREDISKEEGIHEHPSGGEKQ